MAKKMLIDATHPEETRVVVADGNKVEEFDFESLNKRQLAGNIYLAKVTRVEPSLQAAFVDYGGNRHGFLAFSEIHPDYYQIPKADRDAILAEERAYAEALAAADEAAEAPQEKAEASEDDAEEAPKKPRTRSRTRSRSKKANAETTDGEATDTEASAKAAIVADEASSDGVVAGGAAEMSEAAQQTDGQSGTDETGAQTSGDGDEDGPVTTIAESAGLEDEEVRSEVAEPAEEAAPAEPAGMETVDLDGGESEEASAEAAQEVTEDTPAEKPKRSRSRSRSRSKKAEPADKDANVETVADDDTEEEIRPPRPPRPKARKYKIQEVVKVRQIMLVQVVKEERGNKGAALTTYLSLAGRYCVLMPNTARGGGISRKITNATDRKKLKAIAQEIEVPQGAGLIVRTAGAKRTKTEIKRDYEYLQRQWEQVRELTLKSIAPAPIYEEGNLIHRSIRDLYNRDIDEVIVEGEAGYRDAKDYMKLIMPSHSKNVKQHPGGGQPLFAKHGVESYLAGMFNPTVQLKSGGYIVIGITEALVAVDVNSGKSTKEGSIEETALKTNLEAAAEVARQAKLRDLAGLIVIDFIDMDERKNNAAVEKCLKDALKNDRARIQVGRISGFGLLEMSRQRLRPGMLEATTQECPHCHGTGLIRSDDSVALSILRAIEEEAVKKRSREVKLTVPVDVCNYLMNEKREHLASIETRYEMAVRVVADPLMVAPNFTLEKFKTATRVIPKAKTVVGMDTSWTPDDDVVEADAEEVEETAETTSEEERPKKKRRRRSRRKKSGGGENQQGETPQASERDDSDAEAENAADPDVPPQDGAPETTAEAAPAPDAAEEDAPKPKTSRSRARSKKPAEEKAEDAEAKPAEATEEAPAEEDAPKAKAKTSRPRARAKAPAPTSGPSDAVAEAAAAAEEATGEAPAEAASAEPVAEAPATEAPAEPAAETQEEAPAKPKRKGWWSFGS
ncbi:Rne/Rng family ribonuclease [Jannaschia marina]|uniref:Rne/Rng family ribonuclease n=1 Tax=Jannaschia marina TaxID=2741674 RepID=UPI0015CE007B|nr:ribonuclease E/G [Jannaschia marina]